MDMLYGLFVSGPGGTVAAQQPQATSTWVMWALIAVMLVVFYFILIRPQRRRAQEHDQMVSALKKGDEVVTIGGIHGVIKRITDDKIVLEVSRGVEVTFLRSAIARSLNVPEEEEDLDEAGEYEEEPGAEGEEHEESTAEEPEGEGETPE